MPVKTIVITTFRFGEEMLCSNGQKLILQRAKHKKDKEIEIQAVAENCSYILIIKKYKEPDMYQILSQKRVRS